MISLGFCVSGRGRLCRRAIKLCDFLGFKPTIVILDEKADELLEEFCTINKVKCVRIKKGNSYDFNRQLTELINNSSAEAFLLTFDKLLPTEAISNFNGFIFNVHMSLLPAFAGMQAMSRALASGVKFTGATIHQVDSSIDGGQIIAQTAVPIKPEDNLKSLGARIYKQLEPLFFQVIIWLAQKRIVRDKNGRIWIDQADYSDNFTIPKIEEKVKEIK